MKLKAIWLSLTLIFGISVCASGWNIGKTKRYKQEPRTEVTNPDIITLLSSAKSSELLEIKGVIGGRHNRMPRPGSPRKPNYSSVSFQAYALSGRAVSPFPLSIRITRMWYKESGKLYALKFGRQRIEKNKKAYTFTPKGAYNVYFSLKPYGRRIEGIYSEIKLGTISKIIYTTNFHLRTTH